MKALTANTADPAALGRITSATAAVNAAKELVKDD